MLHPEWRLRRRFFKWSEVLILKKAVLMLIYVRVAVGALLVVPMIPRDVHVRVLLVRDLRLRVVDAKVRIVDGTAGARAFQAATLRLLLRV